jgi:hypothetical protein
MPHIEKNGEERFSSGLTLHAFLLLYLAEENLSSEGGRERERKSIILLEGSQATPTRPSGRNNVKVNTLW